MNFRFLLSLNVLILGQSLFGQNNSIYLPKNSSFVESGNLNVKWNGEVNKYSYTIEWSNDNSFNTFLGQISVGSSLSGSVSLMNEGNYFLRIKATNLLTSETSWGPKIEITCFTPKDVSSLELWLRADQVELDANNKVLKWTDLSSNKYDISQTNLDKRPSVDIASLNALPSVLFNGKQFLSGRDILDLGTASMSVFSVAKLIGPSQALFAKSKAAAAQGRWGLVKAFSGNYQTGLIYHENTENNLTANVHSNDFALYGAVIDRTKSKNQLILNNKVLSEKSINKDFNFNTDFRFLVGAHNDANDIGEVIHLNGNISEMIFVRSSDSLLNFNIQSYLRYKYSPPVNLGKDTTIADNFCPINLSIPVSFSNVLWSTGETTASISAKQPGLYWVRATDIFGYVSRDTIQVNYPAVSSNNFVCQGKSRVWSAGLGPDFSYEWSTGEKTETVTIPGPGTYSVTVLDKLGCKRTFNNVNFTTDNYEHTAFLGKDTALCSGNLLALKVGAAETVSYAWQNGAPSTQATYTVGASGNYWVESVNKNGCVARDTINITVIGTAPQALFSVNNHCRNTPVPLENKSFGAGADAISTWNWDFGNGVKSALKDPNYVYPMAGVYPITLFVQSTAGCGAEFKMSVQVHEIPKAEFSSIGNCATQEVRFTDASTKGDKPVTDYFWNFGYPASGQNNSSYLSSPKKVYDLPGSYVVKLLVADENGCKDSLSKNLTIHPTPVPDFSYISACEGSPVTFASNTITTPNPSYLWNFGGNTTSILPNPSHTFPKAGKQTVSLQVRNTDNCWATHTEVVEVYAFPVPSLSIGPACKDAFVEVKNTSKLATGKIDSTLWVINKSDTLHGTIAAWRVKALGQQQIELFTKSANGCKSDTSLFFNVTDQFKASFATQSTIIPAEEPFTFTNTSNPGSIALWIFGDGNVSNEFSPKHTFDEKYIDSSLTVTLIAMNIKGCRDTSVQKLFIRRPSIDLEISYLFLEKKDNWYILGVEMKNKGTVTLTSADIICETTKGLLFNDTWKGKLLPGKDTIYALNAMPTSIFSSQDAVESYVCVNAKGYGANGMEETYLDNNKACRNIEGKSIVLLPVFPNPVENDFSVRLYLPEQAEVYLSLDDLSGRTVRLLQPKTKLLSGYYEYGVDADQLSKGIYYVNLRSGDKTESFKLSVVK